MLLLYLLWLGALSLYLRSNMVGAYGRSMQHLNDAEILELLMNTESDDNETKEFGSCLSTYIKMSRCVLQKPNSIYLGWLCNVLLNINRCYGHMYAMH